MGFLVQSPLAEPLLDSQRAPSGRQARGGSAFDLRIALSHAGMPAFRLEHDLANVSRAVRDMRIDYSVAIDNDYAVWNAFADHYLPALYFAGARRIRHHHF